MSDTDDDVPGEVGMTGLYNHTEIILWVIVICLLLFAAAVIYFFIIIPTIHNK